MKKIITLGNIILATFLISTQSVFAACFVNGRAVSCDSFPWWILIVIFVAGILFFVFWLQMLIHAVKSSNPSKVGWILLIVLIQVLGAIIYYFVVKRKEQSV